MELMKIVIVGVILMATRASGQRLQNYSVAVEDFGPRWITLKITRSGAGYTPFQYRIQLEPENSDQAVSYHTIASRRESDFTMVTLSELTPDSTYNIKVKAEYPMGRESGEKSVIVRTSSEDYEDYMPHKLDRGEDMASGSTCAYPMGLLCFHLIITWMLI